MRLISDVIRMLLFRGRLIVILVFCSTVALAKSAKTLQYNDSWATSGITVERSTKSEIVLNFSINKLQLVPVSIFGRDMYEPQLPGFFLPGV